MGKGENCRPRSALAKAAPVLLVASGALLILMASAMKWQSGERQEALLRAYDLALAASEAPGEPGNEDTALTATTSSPDRARGPNSPDNPSDGQTDIDPICLLVIPKIGLTVAVAEGVENRTLRYAVGHFEGTALPGEIGNFSVAGHSNSAFGEFFHRLDEVEVGDVIIVECDGESYTYVVSERLVVEPEDTWVLDPTPDARITLVTCTGARLASRLIIRGALEWSCPP